MTGAIRSCSFSSVGYGDLNLVRDLLSGAGDQSGVRDRSCIVAGLLPVPLRRRLSGDGDTDGDLERLIIDGCNLLFPVSRIGTGLVGPPTLPPPLPLIKCASF